MATLNSPTGSGVGSGAGDSYINDSGSGEGDGIRYGVPHGDGSGHGYGAGNSYGHGYIEGYGYGTEYSIGNKDDDRDGDGYGYGTGYSEGDGSCTEYSIGYGDEDCAGDGSGDGYGYGYIDGSGHGSGYGYGHGNEENDYLDTYWKPARAYLTAVHVLRIPNTEMRRLLIELMGYERFISTAEAHMVSEDRFGCLLEVVGIPVRFVELTDRTPQPGGTFRKYWEPVPRTVRTPAQAVAWQWQFDLKEFTAMVNKGWIET